MTPHATPTGRFRRLHRTINAANQIDAARELQAFAVEVRATPPAAYRHDLDGTIDEHLGRLAHRR
jgi:hypothetical protein